MVVDPPGAVDEVDDDDDEEDDDEEDELELDDDEEDDELELELDEEDDEEDDDDELELEELVELELSADCAPANTGRNIRHRAAIAAMTCRLSKRRTEWERMLLSWDARVTTRWVRPSIGRPRRGLEEISAFGQVDNAPFIERVAANCRPGGPDYSASVVSMQSRTAASIAGFIFAVSPRAMIRSSSSSPRSSTIESHMQSTDS